LVIIEISKFIIIETRGQDNLPFRSRDPEREEAYDSLFVL